MLFEHKSEPGYCFRREQCALGYMTRHSKPFTGKNLCYDTVSYHKECFSLPKLLEHLPYTQTNAKTLHMAKVVLALP